MVGLDSRALEEVIRDHQKLLFRMLADGRLDQAEAEYLFLSLSVALAEKAAQGKSVEQIAGELALKVTGVLADVFTTTVEELEERHKRALAENDLARAARIMARIEKKRAKEEERERPAARVERRAALPPPRAAGLSRPSSALPGPLEAGGGVLLPPAPPVPAAPPPAARAVPPAPPDPTAIEPELVPLEDEEHKSGRHAVFVRDPSTGQKVRKELSPFGAPVKG